MRYLTLAIAILLGCAHAAAAGTSVTSDLCFHHDGGWQDAACDTYIGGFAAGLAAGQELAIRGARTCFPSASTVGQERLVVDKYIRDHPENLHLGDGAVVWLALHGAFPCKSRQ